LPLEAASQEKNHVVKQKGWTNGHIGDGCGRLRLITGSAMPYLDGLRVSKAIFLAFL